MEYYGRADGGHDITRPGSCPGRGEARRVMFSPAQLPAPAQLPVSGQLPASAPDSGASRSWSFQLYLRPGRACRMEGLRQEVVVDVW